MENRQVNWFIISAATALGASPAFAQDEANASADVQLQSSSASTEPSVETASDAELPPAEDISTEPTSDESAEVPYSKRYLPQPNTLEVGIFAGAFFISDGHDLVSAGLAQQAYSGPAFELGARLGYYPLSWLGVEGEFSMGQASFDDDLSATVDPSLVANRGTLSTYRGHVVAQLPISSIVPFLLVGGGALAATSQVEGHKTEGAFHFGAGLKVPVCESFALRAEFRETLHGRTNDNYGGISFSEEVLVGAAFTWGGAKKAVVAPPPPDADKDGVPDDIDACPEVAALTDNGCPLDTDGDGIADPDDFCPREAGTLENGCPDPDPDGDGVPAACDQCPEEKGEAPTGCVNRDPDGDGILEPEDKCPNEPETVNGYEDADGCPDEMPKEIEKFTGSIEGIQFDQGKASIKRSSESTLHAAADVLKKYPTIRVEISGHTSSDGNADFNQKLSEERAQAVVDWLVRAGVAQENLVARGAGSTEPLADNATAAGRIKNRRIEFKILRR